MSLAEIARHHYSFPVISGVTAQQSPEERRDRMQLYQHMMQDLNAESERPADQISEVNLADSQDAVLLMPEQGADVKVHLGEEHFLERLHSYQNGIAAWRQQFPRLIGVDLRNGPRAVLELSREEASVVSASQSQNQARASKDASKPGKGAAHHGHGPAATADQAGRAVNASARHRKESSRAAALKAAAQNRNRHSAAQTSRSGIGLGQ